MLCLPVAARLLRVAVAVACWSNAAGALAGEFAVSGLARVATDYVARGYSKTDDRPGLQLQAAATAPAKGPLAGVYTGAWLNRVELGGARWEAVPYVGWRRPLGRDWQIDATLAGYLYDERFEARASREAHYAEVLGAVHYRDWFTARAGVSIAPYGFGGSAPEIEIRLRQPLSDVLTASASLGHAWLDDYAGYEVTHYALGVGWIMSARVQADLRWYGAVTRAERPSAPAHDFFERLLIDDRLVAAFSVSF